jgi:predicted transcriptional regulator
MMFRQLNVFTSKRHNDCNKVYLCLSTLYNVEETYMLAPCEVAVKCALPAVRAMVAKELTTKHGLKQADAARLLGVSQPAISLYRRRIRGKAIELENDKDIRGMTVEFAGRLSKGNLSYVESISSLCQICRTVRAKGLLCAMHKIFEPALNIDQCKLCTSIELTNCI